MSTSQDIVIVAGKRTPFGSFCGSLKDLTATDLGVEAAKAALASIGADAGVVDAVFFGNVLQSSQDAIYLARHIGLRSGGRQDVPALTLNRLCGSGFEAIAMLLSLPLQNLRLYRQHQHKDRHIFLQDISLTAFLHKKSGQKKLSEHFYPQTFLNPYQQVFLLQHIWSTRKHAFYPEITQENLSHLEQLPKNHIQGLTVLKKFPVFL